ncbi:COG2740: Predicted nucleic-acid-binding protein implicated in transcription termination [hydrothermal vent metagenome]|uniref:COG2740: Predicted nucleic-acid-binding protein implicated in transcription termination n=1 Tax=hydrothermal vent metagenome TaxID=652676 RepID=A0A1W1EEE2_9ZZZZ
MKKSQPIRMCISCRNRHPQNSLIRLKQEGQIVIEFDGTGRSFYLCGECANNNKQIKGLMKRFKQEEERFIKLLKKLIDKSTHARDCIQIKE